MQYHVPPRQNGVERYCFIGEGNTVEVEIFRERIPATVARDPLYDPKNENLKG
jgi:glycine cleavage system aminomethyltransferase T